MSTGAAAGAAASGQGDAGGQAADGQQQQGTTESAAPTVDQLAAGLASQQATQQEMYDFLRANLGQQQSQAGQETGQQQAAEPEPLDLSFLNMDDPTFDPGQVAQQLGTLIESTVDQRVKQGIEQAVTPLQSNVAQMQREAEAAALVGEFPEMGDPETSQAVLQTSAQLAQAAGHPELADQPWFWRLTYMAGRAADAAQEEAGDTPATAQLESGSGATPGSRAAGMTGDDIVGAKRGASVLPFG